MDERTYINKTSLREKVKAFSIHYVNYKAGDGGGVYSGKDMGVCPDMWESA